MLQTTPRRLRLLFVDGNTREDRANQTRAFGGLSFGAAYAHEVQALAPDSTADICFPADEGANLPDAAGLESYDGVFLTGSTLHIYDPEPAVTRQIELMRAIYASGTPCFGSCWGIQVGTVAAGGTVVANPKGREVGFARRITLTEAGRGHGLLTGRPQAFDAPAIHLDTVAVAPEGATVLASNAYSAVHACEIESDGGLFWGVQYHPEFSLGQLSALLKRMTPQLVSEGFRKDEAAAEAWFADLDALDAEPGRGDLAWAHGLDEEVLDASKRVTELRNFVEARVRPGMSARGRG